MPSVRMCLRFLADEVVGRRSWEGSSGLKWHDENGAWALGSISTCVDSDGKGCSSLLPTLHCLDAFCEKSCLFAKIKRLLNANLRKKV